MKRTKLFKRAGRNLPTMVVTAALAIVVVISVIYSVHKTGPARSTVAVHDSALATPVAKSAVTEREEGEMVAFEFPVEGPIKTYHMDHDQEAIVTMYWHKETWAHIERFTSKVYPDEPTVLELEEPEPGLYPLKLDSGEIRGYVQVD